MHHPVSGIYYLGHGIVNRLEFYFSRIQCFGGVESSLSEETRIFKAACVLPGWEKTIRARGTTP